MNSQNIRTLKYAPWSRCTGCWATLAGLRHRRLPKEVAWVYTNSLRNKLGVPSFCSKSCPIFASFSPLFLNMCINSDLLHLAPNSTDAEVFDGFEKSLEKRNSTKLPSGNDPYILLVFSSMNYMKFSSIEMFSTRLPGVFGCSWGEFHWCYLRIRRSNKEQSQWEIKKPVVSHLNCCFCGSASDLQRTSFSLHIHVEELVAWYNSVHRTDAGLSNLHSVWCISLVNVQSRVFQGLAKLEAPT